MKQLLRKFIQITKWTQKHQKEFIVCINHNMEQYGGWELSMSLKLAISTILKSSFCKIILLIKLKCNKDQIHGLNWVLENKVNL